MSIYEQLIQNSIVGFVISLIILIIGLILMLYGALLSRQHSISKELYYLGWVSLIIGLWSVNENGIMCLLYQNRILSINLTYMLLMIVTYPFILFVMTYIRAARDVVWKVLFGISFVTDVIVIGMQLFGVRDIGQNMFLIHIQIVVNALYAMTICFKTMHNRRLKTREIHGIIAFAIVTIGALCDIFVAYSGIERFTKRGLYAYIICLLILTFDLLSSASEKLSNVHRADVWKEIAMSDTMTGLLNRNAFNHDIEEMTDPLGVMIINCDLNNLKKVNDTMGHQAGDEYIITCANLIKNYFNDYGRCYRIGGDEFSVIVDKAKRVDIVEKRNAIYADEISIFSGYDEKLRIGMAVGSATFDPEQDRNIEDTMRRADKIMYREKRAMKNPDRPSAK